MASALPFELRLGAAAPSYPTTFCPDSARIADLVRSKLRLLTFEREVEGVCCIPWGKSVFTLKDYPSYIFKIRSSEERILAPDRVREICQANELNCLVVPKYKVEKLQDHSYLIIEEKFDVPSSIEEMETRYIETLSSGALNKAIGQLATLCCLVGGISGEILSKSPHLPKSKAHLRHDNIPVIFGEGGQAKFALIDMERTKFPDSATTMSSEDWNYETSHQIKLLLACLATHQQIKDVIASVKAQVKEKNPLLDEKIMSELEGYFERYAHEAAENLNAWT